MQFTASRRLPSLSLILTVLLLMTGTLAAQPSGAPATTQPAPVIKAYNETIDMRADGHATVIVDLALSPAGQREIDLPLDFSQPLRMKATASAAGVSAAPGRAGDTRVIKLAFEQPLQEDMKATITFDVDKFNDSKKPRNGRGIYNYAFVFRNATPTRISNYALRLLLPPDYLVHGVTSSTPRNTGTEVEPPYVIGQEAGRSIVTLRSKVVAPGNNAAIAFTYQNDTKPQLFVIVVCLLLGAAALYLKRDVLTNPDYEPHVAA